MSTATEVKHTPGPWTKRGGNTTVYVGKGLISYEPKENLTEHTIPNHVVRVFTDSEGRRVTQFVADCNGAGMPNAANASLIAAAPEMLEALELGQELFARIWRLCDLGAVVTDQEAHAFLERSLLALTKARNLPLPICKACGQRVTVSWQAHEDECDAVIRKAGGAR